MSDTTTVLARSDFDGGRLLLRLDGQSIEDERKNRRRSKYIGKVLRLTDGADLGWE